MSVTESQEPRPQLALPRRVGRSINGISDATLHCIEAEYQFISEEPIACGGQGLLFRVRKRRNDRILVLKVALDGHQDEIERERKFYRGRKFPSHLAPSFHGPLNDGGLEQPWLVVDFVDGTPIDLFADKLRDGGHKERLLELLIQYFNCLQEFHDAGVVLSDIKPAHTLVNKPNHLTFLDFGGCKEIYKAKYRSTRSGNWHSPIWGADPVRLGQRNTAEDTDIHSAARVAFRVITGLSPEPKKSESGAIPDKEPYWQSRLRASGQREEVQRVILNGLLDLGKCDEQRIFGTAGELSDALAGARVKARKRELKSSWNREKLKLEEKYQAEIAAIQLAHSSESDELKKNLQQRMNRFRLSFALIFFVFLCGGGLLHWYGLTKNEISIQQNIIGLKLQRYEDLKREFSDSELNLKSTRTEWNELRQLEQARIQQVDSGDTDAAAVTLNRMTIRLERLARVRPAIVALQGAIDSAEINFDSVAWVRSNPTIEKLCSKLEAKRSIVQSLCSSCRIEDASAAIEGYRADCSAAQTENEKALEIQSLFGDYSTLVETIPSQLLSKTNEKASKLTNAESFSLSARNNWRSGDWITSRKEAGHAIQLLSEWILSLDSVDRSTRESAMMAQLKSLENQASELQSRNDDASEQLAGKDEKVRELQEQVTDQNAQNLNDRKARRNAENELATTRAQMNESALQFESDLKKVKADYANERTERTKLAAELSSEKSAKQELEKQIVSVREAGENEVNRLEKELSGMTDRFKNLSEKSKTAIAEHDNLLARISGLEESNAKQKSELATNSDLVAQLTKSRDRWKTHAEKELSQMESAEAAKQKQAELAEMDNEISESKESNPAAVILVTTLAVFVAWVSFVVFKNEIYVSVPQQKTLPADEQYPEPAWEAENGRWYISCAYCGCDPLVKNKEAHRDRCPRHLLHRA